jgi:sugar/nucleoside kinase (ribokinase family)
MSKFLIMGPVTMDTIVRNETVYHSIGGAVYYQAAVLSGLGVDTTAVITVSTEDESILDVFPNDISIVPVFVDKTMKFENIYPNHDPNHRIQRAEIESNPIKPEDISNLDLKTFDAFILSSLSPFDIPIETVKFLSQFQIPMYAGVQGYLRHIKNHKVILKPWNDFQKFLKFFDGIFLDEMEARVILGTHVHKLEGIAKTLASFGPKEVIITRGDRGATIYYEKTNSIYQIPAVPSKQRTDPTGLGDTYMAAYVSRKMEKIDPETCGTFASAAATIKLEGEGAFKGNRKLIEDRLMKTDFLVDKKSS